MILADASQMCRRKLGDALIAVLRDLLELRRWLHRRILKVMASDASHLEGQNAVMTMCS